MAKLTDKKLIAMLAAADKRVKVLINRFIAELAAEGIKYADLDADDVFNFAAYPKADKRVARLVDKYAAAIESIIVDASVLAMKYNYKAAAQALSQLDLPDSEVFAVEYSKSVQNAFEQYRDAHRKGLNLSQRVWNYTSQSKSEFEMAMSQAIEDGLQRGTSAETLAREVRKRLNRPDEVYRRYHLRKMQSDGTVKDTIEWRRKTVDSEGNVHFTSTDIERVGRGVYRSSRQNALRLTSNEINMAYRFADNQRMNADKFTRGYEIRLSNNHPEYDICDELQGIYPKQFVFTQWHPRCRCAVIPIVCSLDERLAYLDLTPQQQAAWQPREGYITEYPEAFKQWCKAEADNLTASMQSGTGAYFIADNAAIIKQIIKGEK
jgi:hypothetical protein